MSDSVSLPSVLVAGVLIFLAIRYFLAPAATGASSTSSSNTRNVDITKVNQISQMFPQLDRRSIAWDLHRNGGSVTATTERCLTGSLDSPPPSYQPANLNPPSSPSSGRTSSSAAQQKPAQDLITRYNLASKLKTQEDAPIDEDTPVSKGWAATKTERAALFAKRREEMILNARKRMEDAARRDEKGKGRAVE